MITTLLLQPTFTRPPCYSPSGWCTESGPITIPGPSRRLMGAVISALLVTLSACSPQFPASVDSGPYEGTTLSGEAPDFRLRDQGGASVQLSDFLGQVVVLAFMDSECQEICPLTSVQLRQTHASLAHADAQSVMFLVVNVNPSANRIEDVQAAMKKWRLDEISNFHFLTGKESELVPVWEAYNVTVYAAPDEAGELVHTPGVFLIDRQGQLRWYVSSPFDEQGNTENGFAPLRELLVKQVRDLLQEG